MNTEHRRSWPAPVPVTAHCRSGRAVAAPGATYRAAIIKLDDGRARPYDGRGHG